MRFSFYIFFSLIVVLASCNRPESKSGAQEWDNATSMPSSETNTSQTSEGNTDKSKYTQTESVTLPNGGDEYKLDENFMYHLSTNNLLEVIDFKEVFEEYNYIPLKQTPEYTIGKVSQVLATEDRLFVVSDGIYCYDFEGNPIYHITDKGHARNEFIKCETVSISDSLLFMFDPNGLKIHVYEIGTGKFLYNIPCPYADNIYKIGNGFVIEDLSHLYTKAYFEDKDRFFVYNEDLSTMKYRTMGKEQHLSYLGEPTSLSDGCILFSDVFEGKVYKILHDKVISYLQIDCDPKYIKTPQEIHKAIDKAIVSEEDLEAVQHVCETDSHIYGNFLLKGKSFHFVFDKNSRHSKVFSGFKDTTPHMFSGCLSGNPFSNNQYIILDFSPDGIKSQLYCMEVGRDFEPFPESHPEYKQYQKLLNCKSDDNPIIAIYKFRSF